MKLRALIPWLLLMLCGGARAAEVELRVTPVFGRFPLSLNSLRYNLPSGESVGVTRLSTLLSGFAVQRTDGTWVELPGQYAWIDAAARRTAVTLRNVPAGTWQAFRFAIGPDPAANASNAGRYPALHPLNPNLDNLHPDWQAGYVFLALEGSYRRTLDPLSGFTYWLGGDSNRTFVTRPLALDTTSRTAILMDLDVAALLGAISPSRDGTATHSRPGDPLAAAFRANIPSAFHLRGVIPAPPPVAIAPVQPLYLPAKSTPYSLLVSTLIPLPSLPRDNPLLTERVDLGRRLFREPLLSHSGSISCDSCHRPGDAFTDTNRFSLGDLGQPGSRHSMSLLDVAWKNVFFWDGRAPSLRAQALMPIPNHNEMDENLGAVISRLTNANYPALFARAFDDRSISREKIGLAIEDYLLTLNSFNSKFDRYMRGQDQFTAQEQRGLTLFFTEYDPRTHQAGADCFHCHGGLLFTDHQFHNNGLGDAADPGRFNVTKDEADRGKFATPSLRNAAIIGPYMHDGRFRTLAQVVDHYSSGIRRDATLDPTLARQPAGGIPLTADDKAALVAFLNTLTDSRYDSTGNQRPTRRFGLR